MSEDSDSGTRWELAYDAAQARLHEQVATLARLRTRAYSLLTTAALFVSFAAGVGLINNDPAKGTVVSFDVAVVLLVLVVGVGASTCYISLTADHWYWSPPAEAIVEKIDEGCSQAAIRRYFIGEMVTRTAENETMIKRRQSVFACATILVLLEVVVLLGTLALH